MPVYDRLMPRARSQEKTFYFRHTVIVPAEFYNLKVRRERLEMALSQFELGKRCHKAVQAVKDPLIHCCQSDERLLYAEQNGSW